MNKTFLVARQEVRTTLRRKTYLFFALGLPLLMGVISLVVILINRSNVQTVEPSLPGAAEESESQGYVDAAGLGAIEPPGIPAGSLVRYDDEGAALAALEAGAVEGYFLIPADYLAGGELVYVTSIYNPLGGNMSTRAVEWLLLVNLLGDPQQAGAVWEPLVTERTQLLRAGEEAVEESWISELLPTIMVLIIYMVVLIPAGALINAVTDEKKSRVIETVLLSVSSRQFIGGKILALGLLGLIQIAAWLGVFWLVASFGGRPLSIPEGFSIPVSLVIWVAVYGLLGYAMFGVLMAGLGALAPDVKDARGASMLVMSPMIVVYVFMIVIISSPDSPFALFMSFFPLTAPVGMIGRMSISDVPVWQGLLSAVLQLMAAIALLLLVARLFHTRYILSGQPFSIGRYFKALAGRG
jgi:ABC-2 type transport system permease protein